ncbi:alpha-hydroxy acid oxidase [Bosea sp. (in: a-proteobacteria)]|uniref:alpha-hydroxy acid oxidase n=1 Tax=Bosea sp. (in: a-proteobacteria) TaxID=1871050 RepID=UPI002604C964|nr:alpha-hydroxy acid oxidase [Bosea sp. (in: a-proteobacteria)]MCO5091845.1 alpha-hydroxy-acid oxidizing protein [Bosea sp. (in: a-proteobacteria)]
MAIPTTLALNGSWPMNVEDAINIEDLRRSGRRSLPRIVFDFIEGGCEDETCLERNLASFRRHGLRPRYLTGAEPDQSVRLFAKTYASPFGIAPTGLAALYRPGGDLTLASAAVAADIPFIQSGASTASIEAIAKAARGHAWYQLYQPANPAVADDLVRRARDSGVETLVLTVDAQGGSNQERNLRNGFAQPLKMRPSTVLEALRHPAWIARYLRHGMPVFEDWRPYAGGDAASAATIARFVAAQGRASQSWHDVERLRRLWPGSFVLKGLLHPDDAARAVELGVDGVIISNHGGRKLDRAPAPIDVLPGFVDRVGDRLTLMIDGGIRRGADIVTALCLGARFCFVGRAPLYGLAAGGRPGVDRALALLQREIDLILRQIGCGTIAELSPDHLWPHPPLPAHYSNAQAATS